MLNASAWLVIAATSAIRLWVIWGSFFWQDDYIHMWTAWNAPASELIWQNWNGHREPASYAMQWLLAKVAPQAWGPAALVLSVVAVGTSVMFWLMLRRWGGVTPATTTAAILFAAWPATMMPQQWLSAGLETVPLLLMLVAGWVLARPNRWTPALVGALAALAWTFHERAVYFVPVLFAVAWLYRGLGRAWRDNRVSWIVLLAVTAGALTLRVSDDLPGRSAGTSIPGALWSAGPGSMLRSVVGWLPFDAEQRSVVPVSAGLWAVLVLAVWMLVLLVGLSADPRRTVLVGGLVAAVFVVEVLSFVTLRGGFAGTALASDPRFTLVSGTLLLAAIGSFDMGWRPVVALAGLVAVVGSWSMVRIGSPTDPGRQWLAAARDVPEYAVLAATPSPPRMLSHFFFTTEAPVYELGTTRTLLQVGRVPARFPTLATDPLQVDVSGTVGPLVFTPLVISDQRQCGTVRIPSFEAGVRVVRLALDGPGFLDGARVGRVAYLFPPAGPIPSLEVRGACVQRIEVGIPGR